MADILSSEEIDALLGALDKGEITPPAKDAYLSGRTIKDYDFKRPDKFSKDQLRVLQMIIESFARTWGTYLSGRMRTLVQIEVDKISQLTFEEYLRSLSRPWVIVVFSAEPLEGNALLEFSPSLAFSILDRLLGGYGGSEDIVRELTEIEEAIFSGIINDALRFLRQNLTEIVKVTTRIESLESNPQFVQIVPPSDIVLSISMEMKIDESQGLLGFCFPFMLLEPISNQLKTKMLFTGKREPDKYKNELANHLKSLRLPVKVELGSTKLRIEEILGLEVGDIVKLDTHIKDPVDVNVKSKPLYRGRAGLSGKFRSVKIEEEIEES